MTLSAFRHANPAILALDLGSQTGWALLSQGKVVSDTLDMRPTRDEAPGLRFIKFKRFLRNFTKVHVIYYEEIFRHEGTHAAHIWGAFWSHLAVFAEENHILLKPCGVAEIKKHVTGKGNASKKMMIKAIEQRGYKPRDDNEADALAILSFARHQRAHGE